MEAYVCSFGLVQTQRAGFTFLAAIACPDSGLVVRAAPVHSIFGQLLSGFIKKAGIRAKYLNARNMLRFLKMRRLCDIIWGCTCAAMRESYATSPNYRPQLRSHTQSAYDTFLRESNPGVCGSAESNSMKSTVY